MMLSPLEIFLFLLAFFLMEPVTYLAHRHIFHGFGFDIHKSHHSKRKGTFERNDLYPGVSALITMSIIGCGVLFRPVKFLIPVGFGMTLYGTIYFFIHDMVIHQRAKWLGIPRDFLKWHYSAHMIHHRYGGEPYGLVAPIVPGSLKKKFLSDPADLNFYE